MAIATGQFTIIDYNDAVTLTGFISSNLAKTQQYDSDKSTYTPDWSATNLVLTPSLFKLGTSTDIIADAAVTSITWYEVISGVETLIVAGTNYAISSTGAKALTIKTNVLAGLPAKDFVVKIIYHDSNTGLDLVYKTSITFNRVVNGGGLIAAYCSCPFGNVFKNASVTSLTVHCDLWKGSVIDTSSVTYAWYQQDGTVSTDQGGGIGWRKLSTDTASMITGTGTTEITVYPNQIAVFGVFKCIVTDNDSASPTYTKTYSDTATIADQSDPIQISISSSAGDIFKNGVGTTTLTAKVFRAGVEIDTAGTGYTYKWYMYDKDGAAVANFGGTSIAYKTGKSITATDVEVTVKGTYVVELS